MTLQVSSATRAEQGAVILSRYTGGIIRVFSGGRPAQADLPELSAGGQLIGVITNGGAPPGFYGAGLALAAIGPMVVNDATQFWVVTPVAGGSNEAAWFRFVGDPAHDDGTLQSSMLHRFDGDVGVTDGELQLPSTTLTFGSTVGPISMFYVIPSSL